MDKRYECPNCGFGMDYQEAGEITTCDTCGQMIDWDNVEPPQDGQVNIEVIQEEDGLFTVKLNGEVKYRGMTEEQFTVFWKALAGIALTEKELEICAS